MKKTSKKGFTLVELVIVIAVIAILSAILIPTFGNVISNARLSAAQSEGSNAMTAYLTDHATEGFEFVDGYVVVLEKKSDLIKKAESGNTYSVENAKIAYVFKYENGRMGDAIDITNFKYTETVTEFNNEALTVGVTGVDADAGKNVLVNGENLTCKNAYLLDGTIALTTPAAGSTEKATVNTVSAKVLFLAMKTA